MRLRRIFRGPSVQRIGHAWGRAGRWIATGILDRLMPVPANVRPEEMAGVRKVLLVRPNFRIGNALLTAPLVPALRERFPGARLELLVGDTIAKLFAGLPVDAVHTVSRRHILEPWGFVALFWRLRRARFDVAVEAAAGSFSGSLYTFLTGARYRVGCVGRGERFINVRLPRLQVAHAYDSAPAFARALGVDCRDRPLYRVAAAEDAAALALLGELGLLASDGAMLPFIAMFVGGHLSKRWPAEKWLDLVAGLDRAGLPFVVFLGPEEVALEGRLRRALPEGRILLPQPLRLFAALVARARLFVTPDSGPMHLAAALGVPALVMLQIPRSSFYAPRGPDDRSLVQPTAAEALAAIVSMAASHGLHVRPLPAAGHGA